MKTKIDMWNGEKYDPARHTVPGIFWSDGRLVYWGWIFDDDNRRDIPRHLTPDLSDAYYPDSGQSAGEIAALWHFDPPTLTYGLSV